MGVGVERTCEADVDGVAGPDVEGVARGGVVQVRVDRQLCDGLFGMCWTERIMRRWRRVVGREHVVERFDRALKLSNRTEDGIACRIERGCACWCWHLERWNGRDVRHEDAGRGAVAEGAERSVRRVLAEKRSFDRRVAVHVVAEHVLVFGVLDDVGLVGSLDGDVEIDHEAVRPDDDRVGDAECVPKRTLLSCRRGTRRVSARRVEPDVVRHERAR